MHEGGREGWRGGREKRERALILIPPSHTLLLLLLNPPPLLPKSSSQYSLSAVRKKSRPWQRTNAPFSPPNGQRKTALGHLIPSTIHLLHGDKTERQPYISLPSSRLVVSSIPFPDQGVSTQKKPHNSLPTSSQVT